MNINSFWFLFLTIVVSENIIYQITNSIYKERIVSYFLFSCLSCPEGEYSLLNQAPNSCKKCPVDAFYCISYHIMIRAGWFTWLKLLKILKYYNFRFLEVKCNVWRNIWLWWYEKLLLVLKFHLNYKYFFL